MAIAALALVASALAGMDEDDGAQAASNALPIARSASGA